MKRTPMPNRTKPLIARDRIAADVDMLVVKVKKPHARKCKNEACGEWFTPARMGQVACCPGCAIIVGRDKIKAGLAKIDRADLAKRKGAIKSRAQWLAEAQAAVNAFIRARDELLPCISCGRHHQGQYHAGHYLSRGARPELRFEESNIHKQCAPCNNHLSGNAVLYRVGLVAKIGLARVEWLEGPHEPAKYTIDDAKAIKALYKAKLKALKESKEC